MTEDDLDALLGQNAALAMVLQCLIQHLPRHQAARVLASLRASADVQREADEADGLAPAYVATRDQLLAAFGDLIEAAALRDATP